MSGWKKPFTPRKMRFKVELWCDIDHPTNRAVGLVDNISHEGCQLTAPCAYPVNEVLTLSLEIPNLKEELKIQAETRWLSMASDDGRFRIGCRFLHTPDTTKVLQPVVQKLFVKSF